jgi:uncharacterized metal-binding protein YceD (DUF177 family)
VRDFPISQTYELGRLAAAGDEVTIAPSKEDLARIAAWADLDSVESLRARIGLRKLTATHFTLDIALDAGIVQSCVVTLDPVRSHIERTFTRELVLAPTAEIAPLDEDGREQIASLRYDLAVPVLEELALAIDPYPRAPGVAFEAPAEEADKPDHPFAALKKLK